MGGQEKLAGYLQAQGVEFSIREHPEAFTAQEVAGADHVPGQEFVKVVIVNADDNLVMLCVPAPYEVDLGLVKGAIGASSVRLASEEEFAPTFADCEVGAMPPFGNLYDVPVYVDEVLTEDERIVFNACNHHETVEIYYKDFERLVQPTVAKIGRQI